MSVQFLTNISEEEFKGFLREVLLEILSSQGKPQERPEDLLDINQAAILLKLKVSTLYEKTCRKIIPHLKKGNKLYFKRVALEKWLEEGKVKTLSEISLEAQSLRLIKKAA